MDDKLKKYEYSPDDPKKLELKWVLHVLRDMRLFYIFMIPVWIFWGSYAIAVFSIWFYGSDVIRTKEDVTGIIVSEIVSVVLLFVIIGFIKLINVILKNRDYRPAILRNIRKYIPEVTESIFENVQEDLKKGMPYLKDHNLGISENYIFGNLNLNTFNPVIIPRAEIVDVGYEIYEGASTTIPVNGHVVNARNIYQNFHFRLRNGNSITVQVNDKWKSGLALTAIQNAGLRTVDVHNKTGK